MGGIGGRGGQGGHTLTPIDTVGVIGKTKANEGWRVGYTPPRHLLRCW